MKNEVATLLFEYLKNVLYNPSIAQLDLQRVPDDFMELAQGVDFVGGCIMETVRFGNALSKGDLHCAAPGIDNVIAAPLKALQSMLFHLTWQTDQVAKGNYGQKIDYLGDFSDSFNTMIKQLEQSREALLNEKAVVEEQNAALKQTQELLVSLAFADTRWIIILDRQTGGVLFESESAKAMNETDLAKIMLAALRNFSCNTPSAPVNWDYSIMNETESAVETLYYAIVSHAIPWEGKSAVAHVITDVTKSRQDEIELKQMAFCDPLTGVYNRRYGMELADSFVREHQPFVTAFIDIDLLKYCNDAFGHQEGNRYIIDVAATLEEIPGETVLCRVGGDEFMVIKRDMSAGELESTLCRLREQTVADSGEYPRSFSYGVSEYDGSMPLSDVLEVADKKMYAFKFQHKKQRV